jgi:hypothetical protein
MGFVRNPLHPSLVISQLSSSVFIWMQREMHTRLRGFRSSCEGIGRNSMLPALARLASREKRIRHPCEVTTEECIGLVA